MVTEKMIFCNHYSNCQLLLTPVILTLYLTLSISSSCTLVLIHYDFRCSTTVILTLYLTLSISSSCTLVLIDYDFRCSTSLDMSTVSISYSPVKIPVDSNARCFTCFSSCSSLPEVAEFCPTLHMVYVIAQA
jgi:hypothetical protein